MYLIPILGYKLNSSNFIYFFKNTFYCKYSTLPHAHYNNHVTLMFRFDVACVSQNILSLFTLRKHRKEKKII